jgi:hypothetical protein
LSLGQTPIASRFHAPKNAGGAHDNRRRLAGNCRRAAVLAPIPRNANEISVYNGFCKLVFVNWFTNFAKSDTSRSCVTRSLTILQEGPKRLILLRVLPGRWSMLE